ncbi:MAG: carbon-nitrogen hydrolase family protein [Promethearchaeota archaeon]
MVKIDASELLLRAETEEKNLNWLAAAIIYEKVVKSCLEKNIIEKAAETYRKLGYSYSRAAFNVKTAEKFIEYINKTIEAYKAAVNAFEQIGSSSKKLECKAEVSLFSVYIADSNAEVMENLSESYKLFINAETEYSKEDGQECIARIFGRLAFISAVRAFFMTDPKELEEVYKKGIDIAQKAQILSKNVGNVESLAEALYAEYYLNITQVYIKPYRGDEHWRENYKEFILKCNESLNFIKNYDDLKALTVVYLILGTANGFFATNFIEDDNEQREYFNKAFGLLEKAADFARKLNNISLLSESIYWLDWWIILGGKVKYLQKRISIDLQIFKETRKIFKGVHCFWNFQNRLFMAAYYTNMAQWSFFTPTQRKSYAEKAIELAKETFIELPFLATSGDLYLALTWSYSQLSILASSKDKQDEYAKKMLQYAKEAEHVAEKYEGGWVRAFGYSSLYKAYKTLADIAQDKENKIKMLLKAIDASEKYMLHPNESRTGVITGQIRLGLLYEELGILTKNNDTLLKTKDFFLQVAKESIEKGYNSHVAAIYEYIARIEDRLSNFTSSASYYSKAQALYKQSLRTIEYKLLKNKINDKVAYISAWNLIELAKLYHKREDHSKAKNFYSEACQLLKNLERYNYEASYYSAWALQEEAEEFSKQERHKEAIEKYELTRKSFKSAKKDLEEVLKRSIDKIERSRIEKLERLANVRMNYCLARMNVEEARILGKQGEHFAAAEKFTLAASQFREICLIFKSELERGELEAVYNLCRAWESMELAEKYEDPNRFSDAANLFAKASELFSDSKLKLLASGNSSFCEALEHGCLFDESTDTDIKADLYPKIKILLRKAASSYEKGQFRNGADWALATSTYFDAAWHLIRADKELDINNKKNLLNIGSDYLKSAAELFGKSGYKNKENEVLERLDRVLKEEKILISALNTIKKPSISSSIEGLVAPACPIETSQSPRINEIRQFSEETSRVIGIKEVERKYEIIYKDLLKEYPKIQRRECRVGIAQIGLSETNDIITELYEIKTSGFLGLQVDKVENLNSKVKNMINKAHAEGINILIFPELIIDLNYEHWIEDISNLAKAYDMYIIPGSYHDQITRRNLSRVIGPEGILWEQEKHIPAMIHLGKKRFKETIKSSPPPKKTIISNTEFGRIAIVICRDFLDMDLRVELKNCEPPIDIIINPAFTPVTADFKAAHFDARRSIYAYCFFANVAEFGESLIYTPEKDRIERIIPAKEEGLIYKDVNLFKLRSERKKWEIEQKKEVKFIQSTR